jgi:hypothetical protein
MARVRDAFPTGLPSSVPGTIGTRQATYWDLEFTRPSSSLAVRVHFIGKVEYHYVSPQFSELSLSREHPVLADYREPFRQLFLSKPAPAPEVVVEQLAELVRTWSGGWRPVERYANPQCTPLSVLREGYGLLISAPATLVGAAEQLLAKHGTQPASLPGHKPEREFQVLCLSANFVVARHFDFELIERAAA